MVVRRPRKVEPDVAGEEFERLVGFGEAEFGDGDAAGGVPGGLDVGEEGDDPVGGFVEPGAARVGGVADVPAALGVGVGGVEAGGVERVGGVGGAGGDAGVGGHVELGGVGVVGEDVGAVDDDGCLSGVEGAEEGGYVCG